MIRLFSALLLSALALSFFFVPHMSLAAESASKSYVPLTGIYGITEGEGLAGQAAGDLSPFFKNIFNLLIGVAGILAVIMLSWGGIEYMMSDVITDKEDAKNRMWGATLGLLLVLFSVAILYSINPEILSLRILIPPLNESVVERYTMQGDAASKEECANRGGTVIPPSKQSQVWRCRIGDFNAPQATSGIGMTMCPKTDVELQNFESICRSKGGYTVRQSNTSCFQNSETMCYGKRNVTISESNLSSYCTESKDKIKSDKMYLIKTNPSYVDFQKACTSGGATVRYGGTWECDKNASLTCPNESSSMTVCVEADFQCPEYIKS